MTVEELIRELEEVEDKSLIVIASPFDEDLEVTDVAEASGHYVRLS